MMNLIQREARLMHTLKCFTVYACFLAEQPERPALSEIAGAFV
jgi:hypothetical protein